jgi:hypothetical protein
VKGVKPNRKRAAKIVLGTFAFILAGGALKIKA